MKCEFVACENEAGVGVCGPKRFCSRRCSNFFMHGATTSTGKIIKKTCVVCKKFGKQDDLL